MELASFFGENGGGRGEFKLINETVVSSKKKVSAQLIANKREGE